jgi:hypothetical protein
MPKMCQISNGLPAPSGRHYLLVAPVRRGLVWGIEFHATLQHNVALQRRIPRLDRVITRLSHPVTPRFSHG